MKENKKTKRTLREVILENLRIIGEAYVIAFVIRLLFIEAFAIPSGSMIPTLLIGDRIIVFKPTYGINFPIIDVKTPGFTAPQRDDIIVFKNPTYRSPGKVRELVTLLTFSVINIDNEPKFFVKRVVGVPGDTVELKNNRVYINGKELEYQFVESTPFYSLYKEGGKIIRLKQPYLVPEAIKTTFSLSNLVLLYDPHTREELVRLGFPEYALPNMEFFKDDLNKVTNSLISNRIPEGYYFVMGDNRDESNDSRYWGLVPESVLIGKAIFRFWPPNRISIF